MRTAFVAILGLLLTGTALAEVPEWEREARAGAAAASEGDIASATLHLEKALQLSKETYLLIYERAELYGWVGYVRRRGPDEASAVAPIEEAAALYEEIYGADAPKRRRVVRHLAQVHSNLCNLAEAERRFTEFLEIARKTLPENDPEYLGAVNDMAHILVKEGKYSRARSLIQEAHHLLAAHDSGDQRTKDGLREMESALQPEDRDMAEARTLCLDARTARSPGSAR
jgi:tetratricopeptide (TPR) repeat protein